MVAKLYNEGLVAKKSILTEVDKDLTFPALPDGENELSRARLRSKWENVLKDYRENIEHGVCMSTHTGEKRSQDEVLSEVMNEIEMKEMAYKFCARGGGARAAEVHARRRCSRSGGARQRRTRRRCARGGPEEVRAQRRSAAEARARRRARGDTYSSLRLKSYGLNAKRYASR